MVAIPFALSVHHFISTVGADVGFASLIGLALLVLLFFSQAREGATLRARADEASLRIQELEAELADMAEQIAALPAEISVHAAGPRAAAAYGADTGAPGGGSFPARPPAAPAGVGAPALAAATRLIPDPDPSPPTYAPATAAGNGNGAPRPVVAASAATAERTVQGGAAAPPRPVAAPSRAGAGTIPAGSGSPAGPGGAAGRSPGAGPGGRGPGVASAGRGPAPARSPGAGQPRYPGSRPSGAPLRPPARRGRSRIALGALLGAVALAAVVVAVIVLTGGSSASSASRSSNSATLASHRSRSTLAAVRPSTVTVAVLNGTDMQGLAGSVSQKLATAGYRKGAVTNAADQTQTSTVVAYMTPADRRDALAVATALKLPQSSVRLIDSNTKAIACPPSQACTSSVVVTVGKDLAAQ